MVSCEKCWAQSFSVEDYYELIKMSNCTPEEQAGPDATVCGDCGRKTVHQHAHVCMACDKKHKDTTP